MAEIIKLKKGDVALRLNQFDNFRLFNLYNDGVDDSRPMDLTGDAEYILIFQSKKKEIRIPEFKDYDKNKLNIDKVKEFIISHNFNFNFIDCILSCNN